MNNDDGFQKGEEIADPNPPLDRLLEAESKLCGLRNAFNRLHQRELAQEIDGILAKVRIATEYLARLPNPTPTR